MSSGAWCRPRARPSADLRRASRTGRGRRRCGARARRRPPSPPDFATPRGRGQHAARTARRTLWAGSSLRLEQPTAEVAARALRGDTQRPRLGVRRRRERAVGAVDHEVPEPVRALVLGRRLHDHVVEDVLADDPRPRRVLHRAGRGERRHRLPERSLGRPRCVAVPPSSRRPPRPRTAACLRSEGPSWSQGDRRRRSRSPPAWPPARPSRWRRRRSRRRAPLGPPRGVAGGGGRRRRRRARAARPRPGRRRSRRPKTDASSFSGSSRSSRSGTASAV